MILFSNTDFFQVRFMKRWVIYISLIFQGSFSKRRVKSSFFSPRIRDIVESLLLSHIRHSICGLGFVIGTCVDIYEYIYRRSDWPPGGVLSHHHFSELTSCTHHTGPNWFFFFFFLTSGVSLSNQRRLLTQQRPSDWDHHQTPPHRGHGCRQGGAQHRHLRRVRPNKAGDFLPPGWCFMCPVLCGRFLVQFKQDKVCVKFIQGASKNGNSVSCKRKNNRLLEVLVPSVA